MDHTTILGNGTLTIVYYYHLPQKLKHNIYNKYILKVPLNISISVYITNKKISVQYSDSS